MEGVAGSCLKQSWGIWDITIITDNCGRTYLNGIFITVLHHIYWWKMLFMRVVVIVICMLNREFKCLDLGNYWIWWNLDGEAYFESKPVKVLENAVLVTGYVALLMDGSVWTWEYNYVGKWCLLKEKQL